MKHLFFLIFILISLNSSSQSFTKLGVKIGVTISGQKRTPEKNENTGVKSGLSLTIEPTILTFGSNNNFDFNMDLSYIQKGSVTSGQIIVSGAIGTFSNTLLINYFSFTPSLKYSFLKKLFIKVGPRIDTFLSYQSTDINSSFPRKEDFNNLTFGITYGFGLSLGQKRIKYLIEFVGQNDFTNSLYNPETSQNYRNYSYIINFGLIFSLGKEKKGKG
jgi:hypothetical protein